MQVQGPREAVRLAWSMLRPHLAHEPRCESQPCWLEYDSSELQTRIYRHCALNSVVLGVSCLGLPSQAASCPGFVSEAGVWVVADIDCPNRQHHVLKATKIVAEARRIERQHKPVGGR
jgi:hypothetical protein